MNNIFYAMKPLIPRNLQLYLRRERIKIKMGADQLNWPISSSANVPPKNWKGWPRKKKFAFILTHDVEHQKGHDKVLQLAKVEKEYGFLSSYNFVPERYNVSAKVRESLVNEGFEVGVHGLNHDGKYYSSRKEFLRRSLKINGYLRMWNSVGYRNPSMLHNLEWIRDLDIKYDSSTFDTDPFEPQSDGVNTIFPFWYPENDPSKGYVELPYTLPQDFTLFILMRETNIDIWKAKLDWIVENGGMALVNVHPDYVNLTNSHNNREEYSLSLFTSLLEYVSTKYKGLYFHCLPKDLAESYKNSIFPPFPILEEETEHSIKT